MPSETPTGASLPLLLMRVSGRMLAIRQREIAEILPLPRLSYLPEMPAVVLGAFHLGGEAVLVLSMASLLGLREAPEGSPLYHHLLLLPEQPGRSRLALLVDRATDIVAADPAVLPAGESFNDCIDGEVRLDGALVPLVSLRRLLSAHEAARIAAFVARAAERDAAFASPVRG